MTAVGQGMSADMSEQPVAVVKAIERAAAIGAAVERPRAVLLFGRGTSEHASLYGKYVVESLAGIPTSIGAPSLATLYAAPADLRTWLAIGVSQSGETAEIKQCLAWAKDRGATTLAITNAEHSSLGEVADFALVLGVGPERAVAATKTFLGQCAALAQLAHGWSGRNLPTKELSDFIANALQASLDVGLIETLSEAELCLVLGRGGLTPMASELALKLMEGCQIWSWGGSWADLMHGPITALPDGTPALAFPGVGELAPSWASTRAVIEEKGFRLWELGMRGGRLGILEAMADIVVGQRIVLATAERRGTDPDQPPGLQKVTQT